MMRHRIVVVFLLLFIPVGVAYADELPKQETPLAEAPQSEGQKMCSLVPGACAGRSVELRAFGNLLGIGRPMLPTDMQISVK